MLRPVVSIPGQTGQIYLHTESSILHQAVSMRHACRCWTEGRG